MPDRTRGPLPQKSGALHGRCRKYIVAPKPCMAQSDYFLLRWKLSLNIRSKLKGHLKNKKSCPPEPELEPEPAWEKIVGAGAALKVDGSETLLT